MPRCSGASTSVDDGVVRHVELRSCLVDGGARPQPREEIGPVAAAVVELVEAAGFIRPRSVIGTKTCGLAPSVVPSKPSGATPTMVRCWPLTIERVADHVWIAVETGRPVGVAEHDDRRFPRLLIVPGRSSRPIAGCHAEDGEVAAGDEYALAVQRLVVERQVRAEQDVRGDVGEHLMVLLQVAEHRVAEDVVAVPGLVAGLRAGLRPRRRRFTSSCGAGTGSGRSSIWLNNEKIAALAPMPSASERIATEVTNGALNRRRKASFRLVMVSTLDERSGPGVYHNL